MSVGKLKGEKTLRFICCACSRKLSSKQGHILVCEEYKSIKDEKN